jgi:predicted enzyme related to lactoylglutathione lyase
MPRVISFEIEAYRPGQLAKFYERVFSWEFKKRAGPINYWMTLTGENETGIDGGLLIRNQASQPLNTIGVSSIDEYLKKIEENKGIIVTPKRAVPGVGWTAIFGDPEGNIFRLMEEDPAAK